jgi:hypothetical protein
MPRRGVPSTVELVAAGRQLTPAEWVEWCRVRARLFRTALRKAGYTGREFEAKIGRSRGHVYAVLRGQRESPWIAYTIYRVIAAEFPAEAVPFAMEAPV